MAVQFFIDQSTPFVPSCAWQGVADCEASAPVSRGLETSQELVDLRARVEEFASSFAMPVGHHLQHLFTPLPAVLTPALQCALALNAKSRVPCEEERS